LNVDQLQLLQIDQQRASELFSSCLRIQHADSAVFELYFR